MSDVYRTFAQAGKIHQLVPPLIMSLSQIQVRGKVQSNGTWLKVHSLRPSGSPIHICRCR
eukprot:s854_g13.t1